MPILNTLMELCSKIVLLYYVMKRNIDEAQCNYCNTSCLCFNMSCLKIDAVSGKNNNVRQEEVSDLSRGISKYLLMYDVWPIAHFHGSENSPHLPHNTWFQSLNNLLLLFQRPTVSNFIMHTRRSVHTTETDKQICYRLTLT